MFSGEYEHTLDDKGRVFLPAKYREDMGEIVVLWRGVDGQVNAFPLDTWHTIATKVAQQNQAHREARALSRILFAANECQVDKQGRILIPPLLRKHAGLDTNLVILGVNDHLEIWSQERWQQMNERLQIEGSEITERLAQMGLVL
jgi:MraZ protein